jgi:hypothetical protein
MEPLDPKSGTLATRPQWWLLKCFCRIISIHVCRFSFFKVGISLYESLHVESKGLWKWCITLRITMILDFVHHLEFQIPENTTFQKLNLFLSLGEGRETPTPLCPWTTHEVDVKLWPKVSLPVHLDVWYAFEAHDQILIFLCLTITFFLIPVRCPLWWKDGCIACSGINELHRTCNHTLLSHLRHTPTWTARSLYLHPPGTVWPSYVLSAWGYSWVTLSLGDINMALGQVGEPQNRQ